MKKSIILYRHAKSDWDAGFSRDIERPLAPRGEAAARIMGQELARAGEVPQMILCSPATRTRQTLQLSMEAGAWNSEVAYDKRLYGTDVQHMLALISRFDESVQHYMLVGHQPVWQALAETMIGGGALKFPTAAMARIVFEMESWHAVQATQGELKWLVVPSFFKDRL